jgi:hypothetical protein
MIQKSNYILKLSAIMLLLSGLVSCKKSNDHADNTQLLTIFELTNGTESASYEEGMWWWKQLDEAFDEVNILEMGNTDDGEPLSLVLIDHIGATKIEPLPKRKKNIIFINNGIHPGEPDGIDASMLLARNILTNDTLRELLNNNTLAIIPYYNIGGAKNRGRKSRANQEGPLEYGFRGNSQNLDLNRDFIKNDSRNAQSFVEIFQMLDPDMYVETHVSNGANYQYTMTCLPTLHQKLDAPLGDYFKTNWLTPMYKQMAKEGEAMCPYVNVHETAPDSGMDAFIDSPRYSTGYAALFQTPGFITETLMLKSFKQRVNATYTFLKNVMVLANKETSLRTKRLEARAAMQNNKTFYLDWKINADKYNWLKFEGYEAVNIKSKITGSEILTFDTAKPKSMDIKFYNFASGNDEHTVPTFFILERGYYKVKELLKLNGVKYTKLLSDSTIEVTVFKIDTFSTVNYPYEGHYQHFGTRFSKAVKKIKLNKGTWLIATNQKAKRFLMEVFVPSAPDSYFNWNFFDTRLQQKEWYSTYVFEGKAAELLNQNPALKLEFEQKIKSDTSFANNPRARLYYLYQHSEYYEPHYKTLPVYAIY